MGSAECGFRGAHSSVHMSCAAHVSECTRLSLGCSCITYIFSGQTFEVFGDCVVYIKILKQIAY